MTDVYSAPTSSLAEMSTPSGCNGSLEDGIAGRYRFSIGDFLSEAWKRVNGNKGTILLAVLFYVVALIVFALVKDFALSQLGYSSDHNSRGFANLSFFGKAHEWFIKTMMEIVEMCITLPLEAGMFMLGLKLSMSEQVESTEAFQYFDYMVQLLGTTLLKYLLIIIGTICFVFPGIYLAIAYSLTTPLVVEKNLSGWAALEASRKAITHNWFAYFFLYVGFALILILSVVPALIGWIWIAPMGFLLSGIVYRTIFGYEGKPHTAVSAAV